MHALAVEAVSIHRQIGPVDDLADALFTLGLISAVWPRPGTSDQRDAPRHMEEALALLSDVAEPTWWGRHTTVNCHIYLGYALIGLGELEPARAHLEQVLALEHEYPVHHVMDQALLVRAMLAREEGGLQAADGYLARALEHARAIDFPTDIAWIYTLRGDVAQQAGDLGAARRWYADAVQVYAPLGNLGMAMDAWCGLAEVLLAASEGESTLRLVAAAKTLRREAGTVLREQVQERFDRLDAEATARLGSAAEAVARAGQAMSLDEAVAEAVRAAGALGDGSGEASGGQSGGKAGASADR
jgi:tetratricopeptide (TPR) repeat protein